jgi:hypothetical protein
MKKISLKQYINDTLEEVMPIHKNEDWDGETLEKEYMQDGIQYESDSFYTKDEAKDLIRCQNNMDKSKTFSEFMKNYIDYMTGSKKLTDDNLGTFFEYAIEFQSDKYTQLQEICDKLYENGKIKTDSIDGMTFKKNDIKIYLTFLVKNQNTIFKK